MATQKKTTKKVTKKPVLQAPLFSVDGKKVRDVKLPEQIFGVTATGDLLTRAVLAQEAASRIPIAHTKTRAERRGGGKKPWHQKGTGRARQGSIRSPQWRKGGVVFGPRNTISFTKKLNKKERQQAICGALSAANAREDGMMLLEKLDLKEAKTKTVAKTINAMPGSRSVLLVTPERNKKIELSTRNLPKVKVQLATNLNVVDLLKYRHVIILEPALEVVTKTYGGEK